MTRVIQFQVRRAGIVAASPDFDLCLAKFFCSFRLVQSLQGTIMAFVLLIAKTA